MVILLLAGLLAAPQTVGATRLARQLDRHYNALHTLQAAFTETERDGLSARTGAGTLYLARPGRLRMDYTTPAAHVFLVDGSQVWQFVPGETNDLPSPLSQVDDLHTPLRFLLGHTALEKELSGLDYGGLADVPAGDVVLHGQPPQSAGAAPQWRDVWLEVSPAGEIVRVVVESPDGATTDIRLSDIRTDPPLAASLFRYR